MKDGTPIVILIVLFVIFGLMIGNNKNGGQGGLSDTSSKSSSIGKTDSSLGQTNNKSTAETIKKVENNIDKLSENVKENLAQAKRSPYYGKVNMSDISGIRGTDPNKEYFRLSTNLDKNETINITGWYLKSEVTGNYAILGRASLLPFPFTKADSDIVLQKGDRVIVTKGFSPIGISFRTNICTGYFEENRTFTPGLSRSCPRPKDENLPMFSTVYDRQDECLDLIEGIGRCVTVNSEYLRDLPDTVSQSCKNYMQTQINYNACVARHFSDTDFPGNEYRLFLNAFGPLWRKEREKINLHDRTGLIVDTIEF